MEEETTMGDCSTGARDPVITEDMMIFVGELLERWIVESC